MRRAFDDADEEEFRDDQLIRMAAIAMDPLYGKPVPPTQTTAAQLIQLAERRHQPLRSRRWWLSAPLVVAVSAALVMLTAGYYLSDIGQSAPMRPGPAEPCPSAAAVPLPVATSAARPARAELTALAVRASRSADTKTTGRYTYVRTRSWS